MKANCKAKQDVLLEIETLSHDGRGIARLNDKTTFVRGALAHEKILCQLVKIHSRYNEANTLEVLQPSPDRTTPECQYFGVCGGCSLQHMNMDAQLQLKQHTLLEQLKHFGQVTPETILPPISGNPWHYRHKARLGARYVRKKQQFFIGFREKSSAFLTNIDTCPILHKSIGLHIKDLNELIASLTQYEHIPQIEVAVGDNITALIIRHMQPLTEEDKTKIIAFAKTFSFHLYLQPNPPEPIQKIWPQDGNNTLTYALPDYQLEMQFHPTDFTQVNPEINKLMLQRALQLLDPQPTDNILDLFCGLGNFTLPIARYAKHVTGIEGSNEMVERARNNAQHNQITNTEFSTANLMASFDAESLYEQARDVRARDSKEAECMDARSRAAHTDSQHQTKPEGAHTWLQRKYDKILLDPPRTGAQEIIKYFPHFGADRIVYVSCNPATLARDAQELVHQQGYTLKAAGIINMFPHTSHIEAIALFEKTGGHDG